MAATMSGWFRFRAFGWCGTNKRRKTLHQAEVFPRCMAAKLAIFEGRSAGVTLAAGDYLGFKRPLSCAAGARKDACLDDEARQWIEERPENAPGSVGGRRRIPVTCLGAVPDALFAPDHRGRKSSISVYYHDESREEVAESSSFPRTPSRTRLFSMRAETGQLLKSPAWNEFVP